MRRLLSFLLAVGAVAGYASGFAHLSRSHHEGHRWECHRGSPAPSTSGTPATPGPG